MIQIGQYFTLKGKLDRAVIKDITSEYVKIKCLLGGTYEVYRDGTVVACDLYGTEGRRKEIKPIKDRNGYLWVNLRMCRHQIAIPLHRLLAICYMPNPNKFPIINHKDENKSNNSLDNLEWCDYRYNRIYSLNRKDPTREVRLLAKSQQQKNKIKKKLNKKLKMAKLTKDKVKAMLPTDLICVPCENAAELDSVYQTAFNARTEMGDKGKAIALSKSNVTMTVVVRTGV